MGHTCNGCMGLPLRCLNFGKKTAAGSIAATLQRLMQCHTSSSGINTKYRFAAIQCDSAGCDGAASLKEGSSRAGRVGVRMLH